MLFVRSNSPVLLFIRLSSPISGNWSTEDGHILVITSGGTNIGISVHWKQRIVELNIEYLFDP